VIGAPANFGGVNGELYGILYSDHIVAGDFSHWWRTRISFDLGYPTANRSNRKGCTRCPI